jgi:hypothetical protein
MDGLLLQTVEGLGDAPLVRTGLIRKIIFNQATRLLKRPAAIPEFHSPQLAEHWATGWSSSCPIG